MCVEPERRGWSRAPLEWSGLFDFVIGFTNRRLCQLDYEARCVQCARVAAFAARRPRLDSNQHLLRLRVGPVLPNGAVGRRGVAPRSTDFQSVAITRPAHDPKTSPRAREPRISVGLRIHCATAAPPAEVKARASSTGQDSNLRLCLRVGPLPAGRRGTLGRNRTDTLRVKTGDPGL